MVDKLENLDNAVSDLEGQVESIKKFTRILDKINKIGNDIDGVSKNVSAHAKSFVDISQEMDKKIHQIDVVFEKNESKLKEVENIIQERMKQSNLLLINRYEKLHNDSKHILIETEKNSRELRKELLNKIRDMDANQRELDQLLEANIIEAIDGLKSNINSSIDVVNHQQKKYGVIQSISGIVLVILLAAVVSGLNV